MSERRITAQEVVEAYKQTGIKPDPSVFLVGGCGCGQGVVYALETGEDHVSDPEVMQAALGIEYDYSASYNLGFHGDPHYHPIERRDIEGYQDGLAARELLGLTK